jgi:flagellar biosynthesis/type III secretory pathway protein FliH
MKKITLTALTTALCSLSISATSVVPTLAQQPIVAPTTAPTAAPSGTPAATPNAAPIPANNPQAQLIEQLKITKDQQIKLEKVTQTFRQKYIAVFTPSQKEQLKIAYQQGKQPGFTLTTEQETKLKAIFATASAQRDAIFTPEQKRKVQEFNKQYAPKR